MTAQLDLDEVSDRPRLKSIFHIEVNSPEEFRAELVQWLDRQIRQCEYKREYLKLKKDRSRNHTEQKLYESIADFWRDVVIDPRLEEPSDA